MSVRKLSVQEISEVAGILNDKESIKVLKEIRDNIIEEEDVKEVKGKGASEEKQELRNFVGFAKGDELGDDEDKKKISLAKLEDLGLIIKGVHLDNKSGEQINKYQITETGLSLLSAAGEGIDSSGGKGNEQEQINKQLAEDAGVKTGQTKAYRGKKTAGNQQQEINAKLAEGKEVSEESEPTPEQSKKKARFPQGESSKTNGNEIEEFKAARDKELGR